MQKTCKAKINTMYRSLFGKKEGMRKTFISICTITLLLIHRRRCQVASVVSDSVRPHGQQPTRLLHPWDSPGKNTGMGCHFLLQCMKVESESEVTQSCLTLRDPMDCSPPGSSVHGICQARVLEWGAIAFSLLIHTYTQLFKMARIKFNISIIFIPS